MSFRPKTPAYHKAVAEMTYEYSRSLGAALKELLETKHIYQKMPIDFRSTFLSSAESLPLAANMIDFEREYEALLAEPIMAGAEQVSFQDVGTGNIDLRPTLLLHNVRLVCSVCNSREAFAPVGSSDVSADRSGNHTKGFKNVQVFSIAYQCQVCKEIPETFLVRWEGLSLKLEGRSPFETLDIPPQIPKKEAKFYRDAVVAMHGGKTLAALFYLRTFLEQFARRVTGIAGRETGENIMEAYGTSIPENLRGSIPSMREWYGKLSEAVHGAREDATLFESAREAIDQHFDVRRVFKIPEKMLS